MMAAYAIYRTATVGTIKRTDDVSALDSTYHTGALNLYNVVLGDPSTPAGLLAALASVVTSRPGRAKLLREGLDTAGQLIQLPCGNGRRRAHEEPRGARVTDEQEHHHHPIGDPLGQEAEALINPEAVARRPAERSRCRSYAGSASLERSCPSPSR